MTRDSVSPISKVLATYGIPIKVLPTATIVSPISSFLRLDIASILEVKSSRSADEQIIFCVYPGRVRELRIKIRKIFFMGRSDQIYIKLALGVLLFNNNKFLDSLLG